MMRSSQNDPAHGDWCADGQEVTVWVDASSLATGVPDGAHSRFETSFSFLKWVVISVEKEMS